MNKETLVTGLIEFPNGGSLVEWFDLDPDHIRNFTNHLATCSMTNGLEIKKVTQRMWDSGWFELVTTTTKCSECEGKVSESVEI